MWPLQNRIHVLIIEATLHYWLGWSLWIMEV